jgi:hypothetical protein
LLALPQCISKHLAAGLEAVPALEAAGHDLLARLSSQSDVDYNRAEFKSLAMSALGMLAPGDPRRLHLAIAVLGLVLCAREPGAKQTWHVLDPRRLDEIEAMADMPAELLEAVREARRFPSAADLPAQHRLYWKAAEAVERHVKASADLKIVAPLPAEPAVLGSTLHEAVEPTHAGYGLDLDSDGRHVHIAGRPIAYGHFKRGGHMTKRHIGVRYLVALALGKALPRISNTARSDLCRGLERATDGGLTITKAGDGYLLSSKVIVSESLRRATGHRQRPTG